MRMDMPRQKNKLRLYLLLLCFWACGLTGYAQDYAIDYVQADTGLYIYTSYYDMGAYKKVGANGLVLEGAKSVILVDAPWDSAQTAQLMKWVADSLQKPVRAAIITHAHEDRIGGIAQFHAAGIPTIGTTLTAAEAINRGFEPPMATFSSDTLVHLDDLQLELFYPGPGHTADNSVVYVPASHTLYGGCFLKSARSKNLGNIADADLTAWPASLERLALRYPEAIHVVPGHGGWQDGAIENTRRLLEEKNKE